MYMHITLLVRVIVLSGNISRFVTLKYLKLHMHDECILLLMYSIVKPCYMRVYRVYVIY